MGFFRQNTPQAQIEAYTEAQLARLEHAVLTSLRYVGEMCINEARNNGSYKDQTGNLRSSIGYVLLNNGEVVTSGGFQSIKNGAPGVEAGHKFINEVLQTNRKGYVLVVVAGMKYAAHVEAMNYNVLTSSEMKAEQLVPLLLKQIGFQR